MNDLDFIASVIDSITWPAAIIVLVLVMRAPVESMLRSMARFRYGDIEIDFGREIEQLEARAKTAGLRLPQKPSQTKVETLETQKIIEDASRLAADFAEPAVGLAWTAVEHELKESTKRLGIATDHSAHNSPVKNIGLLFDRKYLDHETRELLDRMRNLRNAAVHPVQGPVYISPDEAREFIALTEAITEKLKSLTR